MTDPEVHCIYHKITSTCTYIVHDPTTRHAMIVDPVMDFDMASGRTSNEHNHEVASYCTKKTLVVDYILETHVHADHLTGAAYLKSKFPDARTGIGENVIAVQKLFKGIFNLEDEFHTDGSQFDILLSDGQTFDLGESTVRTMHTPGHTPACVCYVVGNAVFTGDTVFMPDMGTARCDFPGGSAETLYESVHRLYQDLPGDTRVFVGHDYQPGGRVLKYETTIGEEKASNKQLTAETSRDQFVKWRADRDATLGMPRLIIPALQINLRNGVMPPAESNGTVYLKVPLNILGAPKEPDTAQ